MVLILIQERDRDEIPLHSLHFDGNHFQLPLPQLKFKKKKSMWSTGFPGRHEQSSVGGQNCGDTKYGDLEQ